MPDKEFDKLFKDKFNEVEIEPSINLWANIEKELVTKRKPVIPIFWMAAASVLIAITALLIFQKTDKIQLQGKEQYVIQNNIKDDEVISPSIEVVDQTFESEVQPSNKSFVKNVIVKVSEEVEQNNLQLAMQPIKEIERLPIKQQEVLPLALVPIRETIIENPIVIAQVVPKNEVENYAMNETDNFSEKKAIRNVGDLINFVVDKVDKRDNKILKFSTDEDDNSSLVGINIGFLKFNKKNK